MWMLAKRPKTPGGARGFGGNGGLWRKMKDNFFFQGGSGMIFSETFKIDGELHAFDPQVRHNHDTHLSMQFWPAYFARGLLRFGVFLRAATIIVANPRRRAVFACQR